MLHTEGVLTAAYKRHEADLLPALKAAITGLGLVLRVRIHLGMERCRVFRDG